MKLEKNFIHLCLRRGRGGGGEEGAGRPGRGSAHPASLAAAAPAAAAANEQVQEAGKRPGAREAVLRACLSGIFGPGPCAPLRKARTEQPPSTGRVRFRVI